MITRYKKLRQKGILGINQRNAEFIQLYNRRKFLPLVDDKLKTKELTKAYNINTPEVYQVIKIAAQIENIDTILNTKEDFVLKPANGAAGFGILVINGKYRDYYRKSNGLLIKKPDIYLHISNILSGMHSLGGYTDKAIVEYRVLPHTFFDEISFQGVPDLRVIVFQGYPIMSMLRVPTRHSDGKANLHQGAIGIGVDIVTGITNNGVNHHSEVIDFHPDTLQPLGNRHIPFWDEILSMSAQCYEMTQLGYLGIDIVIDKDFGPLILEMNARPGLSIQVANERGLLHRLQRIQKLPKLKENATERIETIKSLFTE